MAYTYTYAYTRAEIAVDQVDVLFGEAGIDESRRQRVCNGVGQRWLEAVGLFLERDGRRVYEVEAGINWSAHADQAELSFSIDLPGWEGRGSPEALIVGRRFAVIAANERLDPRFWVRFVKAIRDDPQRHESLCDEVGVVFHGRLPGWKRAPETRSFPLQDLGEIDLHVRSAL
jgi:hypothetical protein